MLVGYSTAVRPGDIVRIYGGLPTTPLVREVYRSAVRAGGFAVADLTVDETIEDLLSEGSDAQIEWVPLDLRWTLEQADVMIVLDGPQNTKHLSRVDPAKMAVRAKGRAPYQKTYLERSGRGEFRWVLWGYPTNASAQDAGMSLEEFEALVHGAAFLDADDPIAAWQEFGAELERVGSFLETVKELRVVGEETDLRLGVEGRTWIRADGHSNLPDGEVFTGPVEGSVEGTIRFTFPATIRGRFAEDVRLRFEGGEVVEATATTGQDFLREMVGEGVSRRRADDLGHPIAGDHLCHTIAVVQLHGGS